LSAAESASADDPSVMSDAAADLLTSYEITECKRIARLQALISVAVLAATTIAVSVALLAIELPWGH
jgi:hypothetical protein